jgi:hypothetical protein
MLQSQRLFGRILASVLCSLFVVEESASACVRAEDTAQLDKSVAVPDIDAAHLQRAIDQFGSEYVGKKLIRSVGLAPLKVHENGRWQKIKPEKLKLAQLRGKTIRIFGDYAEDRRKSASTRALLIGTPRDSCGGAPAVGLDRALKVKLNPVVIEAVISDSPSFNIGRGFPVYRLQLTRARLIAQGPMAVDAILAFDPPRH